MHQGIDERNECDHHHCSAHKGATPVNRLSIKEVVRPRPGRFSLSYGGEGCVRLTALGPSPRGSSSHLECIVSY